MVAIKSLAAGLALAGARSGDRGREAGDTTTGSAWVSSAVKQVESGIAVSGGGSRSMASVMGQYRALGSEFVAQFDAISSVSGGTWGSSVYMFADGTDDELLGSASVWGDPTQLSMDVLEGEPGALGAVLTAKTIEIAAEILALDALPGMSEDLHALWQATVGEAFLKPFGLDGDQFLAASAEKVANILRRNPDLGLSARDFVTPRTDRPGEYIIGASLLSPVDHAPTQSSVGFFQITPSFAGVPAGPIEASYPCAVDLLSSSPSCTGNVTTLVGGGMLETFALGGAAPAAADLPLFRGRGGQGGRPALGRAKLATVGVPTQRKDRFSLADATGASSAAFAAVMAEVDDAQDVDPILNYWSPRLGGGDDNDAATEHLLGDGGNTEDTGVVALLQRGARRIASFINTDSALDMSTDLCSASVYRVNGGLAAQESVTNQFAALFQGYPAMDSPSFINDNVVFAHRDMRDVLCRGQTLVKEGKPFVVKASHRVLPNKRWGIRGGWNATIVWTLNTVVDDFESQLPADTQQELAKGADGAFANFPYLLTMFQNAPDATAYTYPQINLMAAQMQYAVSQNIDLFHGLLQD